MPKQPLTNTERQRRWRERHRGSFNHYHREYTRTLREKLFDLYGMKCNCCGESSQDFLTIDHVNNDGAVERKKFGHKQTLYNAILRKGYQSNKYQILCMNCNWAKRKLGICPHKIKSEVASPND